MTSDRVEDLLLRWEELSERGESVTPEELCRDCPELLDLARHYNGPQGQGAHHATWGPGDSSATGSDSGPAPHDPSDDPARLAAWGEFHERIGSLPDEERAVFDLIWYQGLSQAEAATLLNVSERTVKRRWQAARLKLHEALAGEVPE